MNKLVNKLLGVTLTATLFVTQQILVLRETSPLNFTLGVLCLAIFIGANYIEVFKGGLKGDIRTLGGFLTLIVFPFFGIFVVIACLITGEYVKAVNTLALVSYLLLLAVRGYRGKGGYA